MSTAAADALPPLTHADIARNRPRIAWLLDLPVEQREAFLDSLSDDEMATLAHDWELWARPKQLAPPGKWRVWMRMAGRGEGKTRSGAEWIIEKARHSKTGRLFLVAPTFTDARDTMVEGESGILACSPRDFMPEFQAARWRLVWPNGVRAKVFSAEKPNRLRGPQHEAGWIDEVAAFQYPTEVYDMVMFGLRIGENPQCMITTTPKPIELLVKLMKDALLCTDLRVAPADSELLQRSISVVVSVGTSYENRANLAESWFSDIVSQYEGTRLGDQELMGVLLTDVPGALWSGETLERNRIKLMRDNKVITVHEAISLKMLPDFERIVVAVDPPATSKNTSAEAGITVGARGVNKHGYLLADRSGRMKPEQWARAAVEAFHEFGADKIVAEANNGGEMVEHTIKTVDASVPVKLVHATRGKVVRAEPIAALDSQGKIHHVGTFGALESQMTTWTPDSGLASPDRYDSRVWLFTELMLGLRDLDAKGWKGVRR